MRFGEWLAFLLSVGLVVMIHDARSHPCPADKFQVFTFTGSTWFACVAGDQAEKRK